MGGRIYVTEVEPMAPTSPFSTCSCSAITALVFFFFSIFFSIFFSQENENDSGWHDQDTNAHHYNRHQLKKAKAVIAEQEQVENGRENIRDRGGADGPHQPQNDPQIVKNQSKRPSTDQRERSQPVVTVLCDILRRMKP
eukprot:Lithocolla_globosa_v1_NODE_3661_length_1610_cov_26.740360.p2 type:complete len:139 gc:universal NODE_3661_length_1610_cov_26.740360:1578-1162(-)